MSSGQAQLKVHCPQCRAAVKISQTAIGSEVCCPQCETKFGVSAAVGRGGGNEVAPQASETMAAGPSDTAFPPAAGPAGGPPHAGGKLAKKLGRLGRFIIEDFLGQGAFGRVYKAFDPQLERHVALKVPNFHADDARKIQRFLVEAKAAARLRHPNIVAVYESGKIGDEQYIASQFVAGQPLSRRLKENPPDFRQTAEWIRQLAYALAYAHAEGIVHRDIKPENVMLDAKGVPQIMDFGLAKRLDEEATLTVDGTLMGTPVYMSPEQARGEFSNVGPLSDQYSLGAVLYELLTGKKPFSGSQHAVITQVIANEPPPPRKINPRIPADLEAICQVAMSKERERRYASAAEMGDDLARWLGGYETNARPQTTGERIVRWCGRNRVVAALSGALAVTVLAALGLAAGLGHSLARSRQVVTAAAATPATATTDKSVRDEKRAIVERSNGPIDVSAGEPKSPAGEIERNNSIAENVKGPESPEGIVAEVTMRAPVAVPEPVVLSAPAEAIPVRGEASVAPAPTRGLAVVVHNPFVELPQAVALPELPAMGEPVPAHVLAPLAIGACEVIENATVFVKLHGGASAIRTSAKQRFEIDARSEANRNWDVLLVGGDEPLMIARLGLAGGSLFFQWTEEGSAHAALARQLCNCAVEVRAGAYSHMIALRTPVVGSPLTIDLEDRAGSSVKWNVSDLPTAKRLLVEVIRCEGFEVMRQQPSEPVPMGGTIALSCGPPKNPSLLTLKLTTSSTARGIAISAAPFVKLDGARERPYRRQEIVQIERQANDELGRLRDHRAKVKGEPPLPDPLLDKLAKGMRGKKLNDLTAEMGSREAILEQLQHITNFGAGGQPKIYFRVYHDTGGAQVEVVKPPSARE